MAKALPDTAVTTAGTPVTINVLVNDTGSGLVLTSFSNPTNGSLVFNSDKSFTYTPAAGFTGTDTFSYTVRDAAGTPATAEVTISVLAGDEATVAMDDSVEVIAGGSVIIPVLANDMAAGGGALEVIAVSAPGHGVVNVLPDQSVRYVPQSGFIGIDSFVYTVLDAQGTTTSAAVTVKVLAGNTTPIAANDSFDVVADTTTVLAIVANDSDPNGGPLQIVGFTMPGHGSLVFNAADKTFTYTPDAGYEGQDQFTYTIRDNRGTSASATVTLTVARAMASPVAVNDQVTTEAGQPVTLDVLANDSLPEGQAVGIIAVTLPFKGKLAFNPDQTITYTPDAGFVGTDDFTYTIGNGKGGTAKATVTIEVTPTSNAAVYANGYAYRRRIAIPASSAKGNSHQNFPLWVKLSGSWLKSATNGGKVASVDGHDLRFELEDGTKLAHELEHYDAAAGKLGAWVRVPILHDTQPTVLLFYYGKPGLAASEAEPATVWQDYLAVWHLPGTSDRSGQGRDLVVQGGVQASEFGLGAGSVSMNGDGVLKIEDASWLAGLDALSVQLKGKAASIGHDQGLLGAGAALFAGDGDVFIQYQASGLGEGTPKNVIHSTIKTSGGELVTASAANAQGTDWQSIALTWQSSETQSHLYIDGVAVQASHRSQIDIGATTQIGGPFYAGSGPEDSDAGGWEGLLDEVRLRPDRLSDNWIAAEHANHSDPTTFYGIGAEDSLGDSPESLVAVPFVLSEPAGKRIDIDVLGAAIVPSADDQPTIASTTQPINGIVSVIDDNIRYTPAAGFSGHDSFTYTLSLAGKSSTAKVDIELVAAPSDYVARVNALDPAAHYRMAETGGNVISDRIGGNDGTWYNAPRLGVDPLVQNSAGGKSVGFKRGSDRVYAEVDDLVRTASFTIDLALQIDRVPTPKFTVLTSAQWPPSPGEISLEIEADGQGGARVRFWSVDDAGDLVAWISNPGTIPVASAFKLSFRRDGSTGAIDVFVNGITLAKTLQQGTPPSTWSAVPARRWRIGEWTGSAQTPYEGLMAELVVWTRAVPAAELQTLALVQNVAWLADFNAGSVITSQSEAIDLTPYAHPVAGITPTIVTPPAFGTATVAGTTINYTAGNNAGNDNLTTRITANGIPSRYARISISVAPAQGGGGGNDWTNGWTGFASSSLGWLPSPLSSADFGVSGPRDQVFFGLANKAGRNGVMYREYRVGVPAYNTGREIVLGFPAGTMAAHVEWYTYIDSNGRMAAGKRFGFMDDGGAGGAQVAGVTDKTTGPLGLPGGWSSRWTPRGSSSNEVLVPDRHALYTYMQNRRAFGASINSDGRVFGATAVSSNVGSLRGSWFKMNWTIVMNSPYNADGIERLWYNDNLIISRNNIIWQENINNHPITRFWWAWMWGGTPTNSNMLPLDNFREYHGDFRVGISSRANALANPWPF